MKIIDKIKNNHIVVMILCCLIPLTFIGIAVYYFGLSKNYLIFAMLLLCPLMHYFMMKEMDKSVKNNRDCSLRSQRISEKILCRGKENKSCH